MEHKAENWAGIPKDARNLRAARAVQDDDRKELKTLLDGYLIIYSRGGVDTSSNTNRAYWIGAQRLLNWCGENEAKPHSVESDDIRRFVASMGDVSAKSRQLYLIGSKAMVAALRWAEMGRGDPFVKENGARIVIKDPDKDTVKAEPYNADEIKKLLEGANERERALILLGVDGGLRVSEMATLEWSGVNADRKVLKFVSKGGKMPNQRVTTRTIDALQKMWNGGSGRVFGISTRRLQQIFQRRCIDAGINARGVHNLRHSCGTRMYSKTKDLLSVQRHLRHITLDGVSVYINLAEGDYESAIRSLE